LLGRLEMKGRNYAAAEDYLRKSVEITDDLRRGSPSTDLTAAFSATVYDRYEIYIECLMHQYEMRPDQTRLVQAFETSERFRGHSLAELLRTARPGALDGIDPSLAKTEESLREELTVKQDSKIDLLKGPYTTEEITALDAEIAATKAEHDRIVETIRARYPGLDQIISPAALSLDKIQREILSDDQTLLLEYTLGTDKGYVWAVTHDGITSYPLPPREEIEEAARNVYDRLSGPPKDGSESQLSAAIGALSELVIAPVEPELSKRRIIIVADGALNYVPFQVLTRPSAGDEPLIATCEIVNVPSASILGELRKTAASRRPSKIVAAFGDPVFPSNYAQASGSSSGGQSTMAEALENGSWRHALRDVELNGDFFDPSLIEPLFYAKRELNDLRRAASGQGAFICSDFAASRERLLSTDLSQYAILHLATHGLLDSARPENSGIVLSLVGPDGKPQNGFVGLKDIYSLHARVDLVVLSACRTALGKEVRGEGLLGLTRGFMYAGASSVMASLWKVDDEATAELMRQFYDSLLRKKMTPAAALMNAQNEIRRKPEWRSPYYWAAFTLQGEYREVLPIAPSRTFSTPMIAIAACVLAIVAAITFGYLKRRRSYQPRTKVVGPIE